MDEAGDSNGTSFHIPAQFFSNFAIRISRLFKYRSRFLDEVPLLPDTCSLSFFSKISPSFPRHRHFAFRFPLQLHTGHQEQLLAARQVPELSGAQVVTNPQRMNHAGERPGSD
jgi:hypothetical protein